MSPDLACRFCGAALRETFCDLGSAPLANSFLEASELERVEDSYPLKAFVCGRCFLVQLPVHRSPRDLFGEYAYFSSFSESWLEHARRYTEAVVGRFGLGPASRVVEIGSNDGYLLRHFMKKGIPVLGVEPAANVARAATGQGIPTRVEFFGSASARQIAREGLSADLLVGNNVLAHVPDVNDFVAGLKILLAPRGVATMEFPSLLQLIREGQFDTIYHEHVSYLSFTAAEAILSSHGLVVFDVEELPTHGGSLRVYAGHAGGGACPAGPEVARLRAREEAEGLGKLETYARFEERPRETRRALRAFLAAAKAAGKTVAAYGAPAKGNTLLNYCGAGREFIDYTVDRSPYKQGKYLPGTHLPIHAPERLRETRPDYVLILPWNLKDEIVAQASDVRSWGGRFVVPIPRVEVLA